MITKQTDNSKTTVGPPVENTPKKKIGQLLFGRHTRLKKPEIGLILSSISYWISASQYRNMSSLIYYQYFLVPDTVLMQKM